MVSRRDILKNACVAVPFLSVAGIALPAQARVKLRKRDVEKFKSLFPSNLHVMIDFHIQTDNGRADVAALLKSGMRVKDAKEYSNNVIMAFASDIDLKKGVVGCHLILSEAALALNANNILDKVTFSLLLSNEASHALQYSSGLPLYHLKQMFHDPNQAVHYSLLREVASDARSFRQLHDMLNRKIITLDIVRAWTQNKDNNRLGYTPAMVDKIGMGRRYVFPDDVVIRSCVFDLWDLHGANRDRVLLYREIKTLSIKNYMQSIDGKKNETSILNSKWFRKTGIRDKDLPRAYNDSSAIPDFSNWAPPLVKRVIPTSSFFITPKA